MLDTRPLVRLAVLLIFLTPSVTDAQNKKYGVGLVPHMDAGDKAEQMLHRFVGEMPEVDQMFDINDGAHMLRTLVKLKNQGKKLDSLVIAGHGSRDNPGVIWAKDAMIPEEIDLEWNRRELATAQLMRARGSVQRKPAELDRVIRETSERISLLEQIPGVMSPNAAVVMINCSAAATPRGKAFVQSFGRLLMGKDGGQIIASEKDITIREIEDVYDQVGEFVRGRGVKEWGAPLVDGLWVNFQVPRGSMLGKPSPASPPVMKPPPTAARPPQPGAAADIAGTWKYGADWIYTITQTGSTFTWTMGKLSEKGEGTITGKAVSAKWSGRNGSGSASGTVQVDASGRATRIDWSNGVAFTRN